MSKIFHQIIERTIQSFHIHGAQAEALKKELESSLMDHKDDLVAQGMSSRKAENEVVKKFGNPEVIGRMFRKYRLAFESTRKAKFLAHVIGILSVSLATYYALSTKLPDIKYWSALAIIGGIASLIAANNIRINSKVWRRGAIAGFLLLAVGQVFAIFAGLLTLIHRPCFDQFPETVMCIRRPEIFLGVSIHFLLFILCLWFVHEILFQQRVHRSFET